MKEEKRTGGLPTRLSLTVRIAVALYLFYTVYSLRGVTEKYDGGELIFFLVAMVFFCIIGVFLCVHSARALLSGRYAGGAMDNMPDESADTVSVFEETEETRQPGSKETSGDSEESGKETGNRDV